MRILLVEDDLRIAQNITIMLERQTYAVDAVDNGTDGQRKGLSGEYDLIILDWMLPDMAGPEVCAALREAGVTTPVLMLTARSQVEDTVEGLDKGADDYLTKPFNKPELLARVRSLLRRNFNSPRNSHITVADLTIDTAACQVERAGQTIELSPKLYALLEFLARNSCQVQSRMDIMDHVWNEELDAFSNTVDVHIRYLRQRIDEPFEYKLIKTVKGKGYMLCDR